MNDRARSGLAPHELRFRSRDGQELMAYDYGGDGRPVLMAHATSFCGRMLEPIVEALGPAYRCVLLDLRAHGRSGGGAPKSWISFADDVAAALDLFPDGEVVGFGHSVGGAAMLWNELRDPDRFAHLYCFEPAVRPPMPGDGRRDFLGRTARRRATFASRQEALEHFSSRPPLSLLAPEVLALYCQYGLCDDGAGGVGLCCAPADEAAVYGRAGVNASYVYDRLAGVGCPVTFALGGASEPARREWVTYAADQAPLGQLDVVAGVGHLGPLEQPALVAEHLAAAWCR